MNQLIKSNLHSSTILTSLRKSSEDLIALLIEKYSAKDGFLNLHVNVETGEVVTFNHNLGDLGDYAQYVAFLGQELGRNDWLDWAIAQGEMAPDKLLKETTNRISPIPGSILWKYNNLSGDYIWGLSTLYLLHQSKKLKSNISNYCDAIDKYSLLSNGMISYGGIILGKSLSPKIPLSNGLITGQTVEPLVHIFKKTQDQYFLDLALKYLKPWLKKATVKYFVQGKYQSTNPIAKGVYALRNSLKNITPPSYYFGKGNIFLMAALLEAIEVAPELNHHAAISGWRNKYREILNTDGSHIDDQGLRIVPFQMIDLISGLEILIDLYRLYHLEEDYELIVQTNKLVSACYSEDGMIKKSVDNDIAHIDHQTDMVINYLKLDEIDGDKDWLSLADSLIGATFKFFKAPYGLYEQVNITTKKAETHICNTKYFGLFLKIHILYNHRVKGGSIFKDLIIRNLATDR